MSQTIVSYACAAILTTFGITLSFLLAKRVTRLLVDHLHDAIDDAYERGFEDGQRRGCDKCGGEVQYVNGDGGWCWDCWRKLEKGGQDGVVDSSSRGAVDRASA